MDSNRARILKWKAVNLANLFLRTIRHKPESICEIGGAEGVVLDTVGEILSAKKLVNYDISQHFCQHGAKIHPHITFVNEEFSAQHEEGFDLIICSDIIEHVKKVDVFLETVSQCCRYALFKIPLEKCLINSAPWYWLHGQSKPKEYQYGSGHYNGHLRGYTREQAIHAVQRHFKILDMQLSHVAHFYGGYKQQRVVKYLGEYISILLFGGALFVLGGNPARLPKGK